MSRGLPQGCGVKEEPPSGRFRSPVAGGPRGQPAQRGLRAHRVRRRGGGPRGPDAQPARRHPGRRAAPGRGGAGVRRAASWSGGDDGGAGPLSRAGALPRAADEGARARRGGPRHPTHLRQGCARAGAARAVAERAGRARPGPDRVERALLRDARRPRVDRSAADPGHQPEGGGADPPEAAGRVRSGRRARVERRHGPLPRWEGRRRLGRPPGR